MLRDTEVSDAGVFRAGPQPGSSSSKSSRPYRVTSLRHFAFGAEEYDFSGAVRGKYAERFAKGSNVIVLAPDVAEVFKDADAVNEALRLLAESVREGKRAS